MLPLSLYVHYPWCQRKCPYCDFNSHKKPDEQTLDESYLKALLADYKSLAPYTDKRDFVSIYFGGGTPSLFAPKLMGKLLDTVADKISATTEISMEANPGTVDYKTLCEYRSLGVNRLSLGVQSFNDHALKRLGRIHNASTAKEACEAALKAGFDNFNIDIMHGLPDQTLEEAMADLNTAVNLGCEHLSWYELTLEEDTVFGKHPPRLPEEEVLADIEESGFAFLEEQGFKRYEISGFCKNKPCKHNLNYWYFYDYAGIGAGAHSKFFLQGNTYRRSNIEDPKAFIAGLNNDVYAVLAEDVPFEFMLNRLRVFNHIAIDEFTKTTALDKEIVMSKLKEAQKLGLLNFDENSYFLTSFGKRMLNDILELFLA